MERDMRVYAMVSNGSSYKVQASSISFYSFACAEYQNVCERGREGDRRTLMQVPCAVIRVPLRRTGDVVWQSFVVAWILGGRLGPDVGQRGTR
jgi:hypothetical protein